MDCSLGRLPRRSDRRMAAAHTPRDLYRAGTATSARFDRVRARDVLIGRSGAEDWVFAGTGGVSTSEQPIGLAGSWYRLPQGTPYDDAALRLTNPHAGRWEWEPARHMPLADYRAALARLNQEFVRV